MASRILSRAALLPLVLFSVLALAQPVVVVLDHGTAPREALRYEFTAGPVNQVTMGMTMRMSMGGQQTPSIAMPTILMPLSIQTTEVLDDGSARFEYEMGEPSLAEGDNGNPAFSQMLGASLGQIAGATGWGWIDPRGQMLDGGFELPGELGPPAGSGLPSAAMNPANELINSFQGQSQQMSAPFPAEPVGVGARWQLTTTMQLAGLSIEQTAEYTLLARDGDEVELGITLAQSVPTPTAGLPPEAQAALGNTEASGSGELTANLQAAVPYPYGEMTVSTSMSAGQPGQTEGQSPAMNMQMTMSITPDE